MSFALAEVETSAHPLSPLVRLDQAALDLLPIGICFCDAEGRLLRANRKAEELWGRKLSALEPIHRFAGWFRIESLNGTPIAAHETPMAQAIRHGKSARNVQARIQNPDGRNWIASITVDPLPDGLGQTTGAIACFQDVTLEYEQRELLTRQKKSFDIAMVASKMGTWRYTMADNICVYDDNAQRLYGLTQARFLHDEDGAKEKFHPDDMALMWSRVNKACDPAGDGFYEVEYRVKQLDGTWRWLSAWGFVEFEGEGESRKPVAIDGASRDLTDRIKADEAQSLLIHELHHRVKNLFAVASGVVMLSARSAATPKELAHTVGERLGALSRACALTLPIASKETVSQSAVLHELLGTIVSPYEGKTSDGKARISISGDDVSISGPAVTSFALLVHEFATNAAKYGALSVPTGHIDITIAAEGDRVLLTWREAGGPRIEGPIHEEGFGGVLTRSTVSGQLNGQIDRHWDAEGLLIRLSVDRSRLG